MKNCDRVVPGQPGGWARAAALTPKKRSRIAKKAAEARWRALTPEQRSALSKERWAAMTPERRSEIQRDRWAKMRADGRISGGRSSK